MANGAYDPADHCKHGVYVGGCGYDYSCFACEMGDPDPTIGDLDNSISELENLRSNHRSKLWAGMSDVAALVEYSVMLTVANHAAEIDKLIKDDLDRQIKVLRAQRDEIAKWADSEQDDDWMRKRHYAQIDAYREAGGEPHAVDYNVYSNCDND